MWDRGIYRLVICAQFFEDSQVIRHHVGPFIIVIRDDETWHEGDVVAKNVAQNWVRIKFDDGTVARLSFQPANNSYVEAGKYDKMWQGSTKKNGLSLGFDRGPNVPSNTSLQQYNNTTILKVFNTSFFV